jgi:hypothetical protein
MNSNKIVITVLILVVLTFAALVVWGSLRNDQPTRGNRSATKNFTKQEGFSAWRKWFDESLARFKPKAKLPCGQNGLPLNKCDNLQQRSFLVLPDSNQSFRTATFKLASGSANVCYRVNENAPSCADAKDPDEDAKPNFEAQSFDLPDPSSNDPQRGTIVVLKKGGKITVTCLILPCRIDLE